MKRLLLKLIVQPVWIDIDEQDNVAELVSNPSALAASEIRAYVDQLFELAERVKIQTPPVPNDESGDH